MKASCTAKRLFIFIFCGIVFVIPKSVWANETETLAFLLDLQRQEGRSCPGLPQRELPHLSSLSLLQESAKLCLEQLSAEGTAVSAPAGFGQIFQYSTSAASPQELVQKLFTQKCQDAMDPRYRYIGAARDGERWLLLLAEAAPPKEYTVGLGGSSSTSMLVAGRGLAQRSKSEANSDSGDGSIIAYAPEPQHAASTPSSVRPGITPLRDPSPRTVDPYPVRVHETLPNQPATRAPSLPDEHFESLSASEFAEQGGLSSETQGKNRKNAVLALGREKSESVVLTDRAGSRVPVILLGSGDRPLRPGGMLIDKEQPEGFIGEAPDDLMHQETGQTGFPASSTGKRRLPERYVEELDPQIALCAKEKTLSLPAARLHALLNERRQEGLFCAGVFYKAHPMQLSLSLAAAAQTQAEDMDARGYFSSTSPDGLTIIKRMEKVNYLWRKLGENIAVADLPPETALNLWLNDASQCKNLMDKDFSELGIGYSPQSHVWVVIFAQPEFE